MSNAVLNLIVLAVVAVVLAPSLRRLRARPLVLTAVIMVALTVVFDSVMIGVGLVEYAPEKMLGIKLWGAPIEDFAYTLVAVVLMPVCWTVLGRRRRAGSTATDGQAGS